MIDEKDLPEDLKGDLIPEIDPKKLFDEKEYSTIILGSSEAGKKDLENVDDATILVSKETSREEKDEALNRLKARNAREFLMQAIERTNAPEQKAALVAACWETGLDFSTSLPFFTALVAHEDFYVSFEAFTVIEEMPEIANKEMLKAALQTLRGVKNPNATVADAISHIQQRLNPLV